MLYIYIYGRFLNDLKWGYSLASSSHDHSPLGMTWVFQAYWPSLPAQGRSQEVNMFFSQRGSCWRSTFSDFLDRFGILNDGEYSESWKTLGVYIYIYMYIHIRGILLMSPKSIQNSDIQNDNWKFPSLSGAIFGFKNGWKISLNSLRFRHTTVPVNINV